MRRKIITREGGLGGGPRGARRFAGYVSFWYLGINDVGTWFEIIKRRRNFGFGMEKESRFINWYSIAIGIEAEQ